MAKEAALEMGDPVIVLRVKEDQGKIREEGVPIFNNKELKDIEKMGGVKTGWKVVDPRWMTNIPPNKTRKVMEEIHQLTHWGTQGMCDHFLKYYTGMGVYEIARSITGECLTCQKVNKKVMQKTTLGWRKLAIRPFWSIQIDFTELTAAQGYKHLLVVVDHLTHWVETLPMRRETAQTVTNVLLEEIILRYGLVNIIDWDCGPHFTSSILQQVIRALGIK